MKAVHFLLISTMVLSLRADLSAAGASPEAAQPRELGSIFTIPIEFERQGAPQAASPSFADIFGKAAQQPAFAPRKNNFSFLSDLQHEIEEAISASGNQKMKVMKFESGMNSRQVNNERPVVSGFAGGLKMENMPNGEVVIEKFEQPFGRHLSRGAEHLSGKLNIEPVINLKTLGKDQGHTPQDFLGDLLSGLGLEEGQAPQPQASFNNAPHPAVLLRQQGDPLGLFGPQPGKSNNDPSAFLEAILGMGKKSPAFDIDESNSNPLDFIIGQKRQKPCKNKRPASLLQHKRVSVQKKTHRRSKTVQLNNFLGDILGGHPEPLPQAQAQPDQPAVIFKPQINSLGLHSGVDQLLNMLEGSEKERLTSPVNEPQPDPLSQILEGNEAGGMQGIDLGNLIGGIKMESFSFPKKGRVRRHRKRLTAILGINPKKVQTHKVRRVRVSLRPKPVSTHIPLMNSFYHLRGVRKSLSPLVFPPLGHKRATLDKIRSNVFKFRKSHPKRRRSHVVHTSVQTSDLDNFGEDHHITNVNVHHQSILPGFDGEDLTHQTSVSVTHHSRHGRRHRRRAHHRRGSRHRRHSRRRRERAALRSKMDDFISELVSRNSQDSPCDANKIKV